ncbi:MAG TPA: PIG-L family deacetylase [Terracidiphilus sp.]|nr:PIG-L family deacetylase [Terracidiphilus sp.]
MSFRLFAAFALVSLSNVLAPAQQPAASYTLPASQPALLAQPLAMDRGEASLEQTLKRLHTTASVLYIDAHPDDEDGSLLTYLSRGHGVRATLFTLNRGEGGQNLMSADTNDALGLIRTNELLKADEYYGIHQLWGTEVDFGFSKTQQESFAQWTHRRVLYDAVLAVRRTRPQIIVATFVGGVSDGHGQHQVSGEIAQEVFKAAADPNVFPDQLKNGLTPWQVSAVYSRTPFARVTSQGIFDYATGHWAPARFRNYITGAWTSGPLSTDVTIPVGTFDLTLGRSYSQIARTGWGMQKSQNGGANPSLTGPGDSRFHLWAVAPQAGVKAPAARDAPNADDHNLFLNSHVRIDTSISGLARLAGPHPPAWLTAGLHQIDSGLGAFLSACPCRAGVVEAQHLAPLYRDTLTLREKVAASTLSAQARTSLLFELDAKIDQFQTAFKDLLGLDLMAFRTDESDASSRGFRGSSADEAPRSVSPGETFRVRIHTAHAAPQGSDLQDKDFQGTDQVRLVRTWFEHQTAEPWKHGEPLSTESTDQSADSIFRLTVPADAAPTEPYFTRPSIEQPYYDIHNEAWRERSFAPYPLSAWAEFSFDGLPIRLGQVVQTLQRVTGPGGFYEPLVVTPAIGVRVDPQARILPLDGSPLTVSVTVHTESAAEGSVMLKLPNGWSVAPTQASFQQSSAGDTDPILFSVTPAAAHAGAYSIQAAVTSAGHTYTTGWRSVGYAGLRPTNLYRAARLETRKVEVKVAPGLRVGYVMGTGDLIPQALEGLGVTPHLLTADDLTSGNLSAYNVIFIGIRAYSVRPDLLAARARLNDFVRNGGTLIVQYQSGNFPAPLPLSLGRAERVVDETTPVKILAPGNPLLTFPNKITSADFNSWVEERGHSFLSTWDSAFTALTETADPGQDPQRGGLVVAPVGKGTFIYVAYALYRQTPELVPGAYRILANLVSAGRQQNSSAN